MIIHRRALLALAVCGNTGTASRVTIAQAPGSASAEPTPDLRRHFIAEAERMRRQAVAAGDQPYGAIVVKGDVIVGWGPSRVVTSRNVDAHAERVAVWDTRSRLATHNVAGAVMYSTSRPCSACEAAAAEAGIARMFWGPQGTDGGVPRRR